MGGMGSSSFESFSLWGMTNITSIDKTPVV